MAVFAPMPSASVAMAAGESRSLAEGANRIPEVLERGLDPAGTAGIAAGFLDLFGSAEFLARLAQCLGFGQAGLTESGDSLVEVELQLLAKLLFQFVATPQALPPVHGAHPFHFYLFVPDHE